MADLHTKTVFLSLTPASRCLLVESKFPIQAEWIFNGACYSLWSVISSSHGVSSFNSNGRYEMRAWTSSRFDFAEVVANVGQELRNHGFTVIEEDSNG